MDALDYYQDKKWCPACDGYVNYLMSVERSFCVQCGDEVRLRVALDGDTVASVSWEGQGCSISQASVSVLHELVEGHTITEAQEIGDAFGELMRAKGQGIGDEREDLLGDATAFVGVGKYPARIKCALIGWMALKDALILAQKETP